MSPTDPAMILVALAIGGLGLYMTLAPRRTFTGPDDLPAYRPGAVERDSEHGRWLRGIWGPSLILFALGMIAVSLLGAPQTWTGRIALALAASAGPLLFAAAIPAGRPRSLREVPGLLLWSAMFGGYVFYQLDPFDAARNRPSVFDMVLLAVGVAYLVLMLRELAASWRDEERLVELYDGNQGYIERPRLIPIRLKALFWAALSVAFVAFLVINLIRTQFSPE